MHIHSLLCLLIAVSNSEMRPWKSFKQYRLKHKRAAHNKMPPNSFFPYVVAFLILMNMYLRQAWASRLR
jgi:hypothetical protein